MSLSSSIINNINKENEKENLIATKKNDKKEEGINIENKKEDNFRRKFIELRAQASKEVKDDNCEEIYLIPRKWFGKLINYINNNSSQNENIKELLGKINNEELLIEKQIFNKALFLDDEKNEMKILKTRFGLCNAVRPVSINRQFWKFLYKIFGGGPEIRIRSEKILDDSGKIIYKKDIFKHIKINCIILPKKKNIVEKKKYTNELMEEIQSFYFFVLKNIEIADLLNHLEKIIKVHKSIKIDDINNYKCWIDLNYDSYDVLYKKIQDKINIIYNMGDRNPSSPINLDEEEEEYENSKKKNSRLDFKLNPLYIFNNEVLMNIFPNQFTDNFDDLNKVQTEEMNKKIKNQGLGVSDLRKFPCFYKFPELNIIIEQGTETIFYKDPQIKFN